MRIYPEVAHRRHKTLASKKELGRVRLAAMQALLESADDHGTLMRQQMEKARQAKAE